MTHPEANSEGDSAHEIQARPSITTAFSGHEPSFDVVSIVQRIIDSVPEKYLQGLTEVVLTNAEGLSRKRRRSVTKSRGRKVRIRRVRGLYHPASRQHGAWIEIFVDNTLNRRGDSWLGRITWFRETELSDVLFHEIGHHIHFTISPEYREKEDVADIWKVRLQRNYNRRHHKLLRSLVGFLQLGRLVDRWFAKTSARMLEKGYISKTEHEENVRATRKGEW